MEKKETVMIVEAIDAFFPNHLNIHDEESAKKTLRAWYMILQKYEFDDVMNELEKYVENNVYPPKMHDLVKNLKDSNYTIPNLEETKKIMEQYKPKETVSKEKVKADLDKLRKQLKLKG